MDFQDSKGISNRKHLEQVWKDTGERPKEYKEIIVPPSGTDLYSIFWDLRKSTTESITWQTIYYYCSYYGFKLTGDELKVLFEMDKAASEWIKKKTVPAKSPKKPKFQNKHRHK